MMSSSVAIPISSASTKDVYVPVHKRGSSLSSSPSSSELSFMSRASSPAFSDASSSHADMMIYTPEELLQIAKSVASIEPDLRRTLRSVAPEIVVTRKRSKATAWHARHPNTHSPSSSPMPTTTTTITTTALNSQARASHHPNGRRARSTGKRDQSPSSQSDNWRSS